MYIAGNEITITWVLGPTASPLLKSDYDISFVPSDLDGTYTDDAILTYVAPTANTAGSITYAFTPLEAGRYKVQLTTGVAAAFAVLDYKNFWVFWQAPTSVPSNEVFGPLSYPHSPAHLNIAQASLPVSFFTAAKDDFERAFNLLGGPIDDTLTEYEAIAYNNVDTSDSTADELPVAYTGDGVNDWYLVGTGPQPSNVRFDQAGAYNGPVVGTYTGVGPWTGVSTQESSTSNGFWYYIKVTVYTAGAAESSVNYCYAQSLAA